MRDFKPHVHDLAAYRRELSEFRQLLDSRDELAERRDILPFFAKRPHLSSEIGKINGYLANPDRLAREFSFFTDFTADLAIRDSTNSAVMLVEFEDAQKTSIFKTVGSRNRPEWSPRFEHGFSQIVDWLWKLHGQQFTSEFEHTFGAKNAPVMALLVIGRSKHLSLLEKERLNWRARHVSVNNTPINYLTYDELCDTLERKLAYGPAAGRV